VNDEKRQENRGIDTGIYISLIVAAGMLTVILLMLIGDEHGVKQALGLAVILVIPASLAFLVILAVHVFGLFRCSRLTRQNLLLWYLCLFVVISMVGSMSSSRLSDNFPPLLGVVFLFVLPVIWLRKLSRS